MDAGFSVSTSGTSNLYMTFSLMASMRFGSTWTDSLCAAKTLLNSAGYRAACSLEYVCAGSMNV